MRWCWGSCVSALIGARGAVIVGLPVINLRRAGILALSVVSIRYAAGARLLISAVLAVCVVNSLSKGPRADKKEY